MRAVDVIACASRFGLGGNGKTKAQNRAQSHRTAAGGQGAVSREVNSHAFTRKATNHTAGLAPNPKRPWIRLSVSAGHEPELERSTRGLEIDPNAYDAIGRVTMTDMLVDFAPYLFRGRLAGFLTRLSATGLANVTSGGGQVPVFRVTVR